MIEEGQNCTCIGTANTNEAFGGRLNIWRLKKLCQSYL